MKIVADYKKRKELKEYLPHDEHWKLKSDRKSMEKASTPVSNVSNNGTNSSSELEGVDSKQPSQSSSDGKRSLSMTDLEEATPPPKKANSDNGDHENDEVNGLSQESEKNEPF